MKHRVAALAFVLLAGPSALLAQFSSSSLVAGEPVDGIGAVQSIPLPRVPSTMPAFSRLAFGAGISPLGVNLQAATNLNRYTNARFVGNILNLNINNISTNGFDVAAKLNLSSAGASVDFYPFPRHALRFSPGLLFYNRNQASGLFTAQGGASFTLNGNTYYSSQSNPVQGNGILGLHSRSRVFTATAGWGNIIPRGGGHLSAPFEAGVAFIGAPTVAVNLTSGQVCDAAGANCVNVATDPGAQADLAQQVAKYTGNVAQLRTYPIVSIGVAYSFGVRGSAVTR
ncbi:MAG TPA: hypothetical protein VE291_10045 [Terracidiphilus sp.]|nr:hypothetical protein [Terracidiphilus sp.]